MNAKEIFLEKEKLMSDGECRGVCAALIRVALPAYEEAWTQRKNALLIEMLKQSNRPSPSFLMKQITALGGEVALDVMEKLIEALSPEAAAEARALRAVTKASANSVPD